MLTTLKAINVAIYCNISRRIVLYCNNEYCNISIYCNIVTSPVCMYRIAGYFLGANISQIGPLLEFEGKNFTNLSHCYAPALRT